MNRERVLAVADFIENNKPEESRINFNMQEWGEKFTLKSPKKRSPECGTPACIAGITYHLFRKEVKLSWVEPDDVMYFAERALGIDSDDATVLFCGVGSNVILEQISSKSAVAVLREFADTGLVNWKDHT